MNKEQIYKLADSGKFVPGIYNYCDRWCERCPLGVCCMSFDLDRNTEMPGFENEKFWEKVTGTLQLAVEMLEDIAQRDKIDLDISDFEQTLDEEEWRFELAKSHPLVSGANIYAQMVENWFAGAEDIFAEKENDLNRDMRLGVPGTNPEREAIVLEDAVEVIRRYQCLIYTKIVRAIDGTSLPEFDRISEDADGSAKVALIALDRSIAMWALLWRHFPKQEREILDILVHIDRMRREIEKTFPDARKFVRPGFDEMK